MIRKKGKHGLGGGYHLNKEDDSTSEKEKERDVTTRAWPPESRGFGVLGQCLQIIWASRLTADSGSVGLGWTFPVSNKLPGAGDAAASLTIL